MIELCTAANSEAALDLCQKLREKVNDSGITFYWLGVGKIFQIGAHYKTVAQRRLLEGIAIGLTVNE